MPQGGPRLRAEDGKLNQVGGRVRSRRTKLKMQQRSLLGRAGKLRPVEILDRARQVVLGRQELREWPDLQDREWPEVEAGTTD